MATTSATGDPRSVELVCFDGHAPARIVKLKAKKNELVARDQVLLLCEPVEGSGASGTAGADGKIRAKFMGSVVDLHVIEGDVVQIGSPLVSMKRGCPHPVIMKDMCADCGADLRKNGLFGVRMEPVTAAVPMVHSIPELMVSNEHAAKLGQDDVIRMLKSRRLALLVDLDQTLIHTTTENVSNQVKDIHHFQLYGAKTPWYHTKLRPGTKDFLEEVKKYYELHICTFGTRMYAHQIAKILDPTGDLFSHRILSRDEFLDPCLKTANMKSLFPCGEQMVCIIDDREDVWNYSPNLIHVKPYHYFKNTGDINSPFPKIPSKSKPPWASEPGAPGFPKPETASSSDSTSEFSIKPPSEAVKHQYESRFGDEGQEESDDYLLYLKQILTTVHDAFYQLYDENVDRPSSEDSSENALVAKEPDLKNIIPYVRKKVLKGCNVVFTGLFPHDVPSDEKEKALALAKSFGGEITDDLVFKEDSPENFTTHLIAAKDGTVKVTSARKTGYIHIVRPEWLTECIRRWERVDERMFPLQEGTKSTENFMRDSVFHRRLPAVSVASTSSTSVSNDRKTSSGSISCLSGMSADILHTMEDEIDDAINSDNDDDDDVEESSNSVEDDEGRGNVFSREENGCSGSRKRKREADQDLNFESGDDDPDDDDEKDAKFLKREDLQLSSSSSSSDDEPTLSDDDDNTLGEWAADLDRQLSE